MTPFKTAAILVPLIVAGTSGAAFAETGGSNEEAHEIARVQAAKVSLGDIIAKAEARGAGPVVEAGPEPDGDIVVYVVETMAPDGTATKLSYSLSGEFLGIGETDADEEATPLTGAKVSLADAVRTALVKSGGTALEARYHDEDGRLVVEVETVEGNRTKEVLVAADTGKVVASNDTQEDHATVADDDDGERDDD